MKNGRNVMHCRAENQSIKLLIDVTNDSLSQKPHHLAADQELYNTSSLTVQLPDFIYDILY